MMSPVRGFLCKEIDFWEFSDLNLKKQLSLFRALKRGGWLNVSEFKELTKPIFVLLSQYKCTKSRSKLNQGAFAQLPAGNVPEMFSHPIYNLRASSQERRRKHT